MSGGTNNDMQLEIPLSSSAESKAPVPPPEKAAPAASEKPADWREKIPTVSQLTRRVRGHIENSFFDVWVRGEISNFRKPVSGHAYFILKDATAQLRGVMFRGQLSKIKFELKDGMEILLHGQVTVYEARGEYQIVADTLEPVGVGALQLAFEQLKKKLHAEGLFEAKYKKALPYLPKRIGIVTSATGAAVRDILKVISRRYPNREIYILPASVQGEKAPTDIRNAIELAERWNQQEPGRAIEVLIVGRGGGSLEDLFCFNDEIVARAIFKCAIPIISAVGHEIDFTIADFVADLRAPTPSAAAEIVFPRKEELIHRIEQPTMRLAMILRKRLQQLRLHLGHLSQRLVDPRQKIKKYQETLRLIEARLQAAMRNRCRLTRQRSESAIQLLHSLSPLQILGRGYSLTLTESGAIVRQVAEAPPGTILETRLSDGKVRSQVIE